MYLWMYVVVLDNMNVYKCKQESNHEYFKHGLPYFLCDVFILELKL